MPGDIVGRDAQLRAIDALTDRLREGAYAAVIRGDPGIGKTVVWDAALERLGRAGVSVLACRPSEAEVRFAFAALRDLLTPVLPALDLVPEPMAHAVRVALMLEDAGDAPVEPGAVETGTLALLRALAAERPVVIAVDDVQWLDPATRGVLAYVLRRVRAERLGLVATERTEPRPTRLAWISEALPADRIQTLDLPPFSIGALHHLIHGRLGVSLPRPRLVRLHEVSGGNPYYALEIASAWQQSPDSTAPLPETLRGLIGRRLRRLPMLTRRVLLAVALVPGGGADEGRIEQAFAMPAAEVARALEPARSARVVARDARGIGFTHPLLAAAVVEDASPVQRAETHERLADTSPTAEERGRHLSLARTPPDAAVAAALDEAAGSAAERGASTDAAELRSLAVQFSPAGDPRLERRLVDLGEAMFVAGDVAGARAHLVDVVERIGDRALRGEALILLATVIWYDAATDEALPYAERALAEAGDDPVALATIHARLAWLCDTDLPRAAHHAAAALELLDPTAQPALYAFALLNHAHLRLLLGEAADHEAIQRGYELQERASIWEFSTLPGNWPKLMDDFDMARHRLETYLGRVRAQGDESSIAQILGYLAELECWTGNLSRASEEADEAIELAEETGQRGYLIQALRHRALFDVMSGDMDAARADAGRSLELAEELGDPVLLPGALGIQAFVALTDGDLDTVDQRCTRATALLDDLGMRDHAAYRFQADHIEALVGLGELERADAVLARHAARGSLGPRPWILATAARSRALFQAAHGQVAEALPSLEEALRHHEGLSMPFELARTLLVEGQVSRRAKLRRRAVDALEAAVARFDELGSAAWSDRARRELARVGVRRGARDELTPTELSVARLAARGLTNREVANMLYISPKTVEANLSRAYAKLGIRSRAELGAVMVERAEG